jgi:Glycosyl hydrolase family 12
VVAVTQRATKQGLVALVGSVVLGLSLAVAAMAANGSGPGMTGSAFGGYGGGGAGANGTAVPSTTQLTHVRDQVNTWLAESGFRGFSVAEVMAFTNNDYVSVRDTHNMPAFELLTDLQTNWLMEEPPSMIWNTRYGAIGDIGSQVMPMMGGSIMGGGWEGWYGTGGGKVTTIAQAVSVANRWLSKADPGERVASDMGGTGMGTFPGYYSFDTVKAGKTFGMLSVNATTGVVWYHGWHGTFLRELDFAS